MAYSSILNKITFLFLGFILLITAELNKNNAVSEQFTANEGVESFNPYLYQIKKFQYPYDDDMSLYYQMNEQIPIRDRKWASQLRYGKRSSWASQLRYGKK
ncbi:Hypothetical protein SRAE_2000348200 [Strongyloides ratti]|uniref:Uncharacterized protein n=1 Tax=Strongyloides ratti TaxID=34506 RepID=A0A090LGD3_STRRB|nr:Hypothetical protein SRAE_2000348200 [Strongyloides ratti]CEF68827.1 Hypothetical protein SRAE_2000348200 [Strongyloides ratti]